MTDAEFTALAELLAGEFIELYASQCERQPKILVLMAMTGSLAACATEAGVTREKVIAALNSAFNDIEAGV